MQPGRDSPACVTYSGRQVRHQACRSALLIFQVIISPVMGRSTRWKGIAIHAANTNTGSAGAADVLGAGNYPGGWSLFCLYDFNEPVSWVCLYGVHGSAADQI